MSEPEDPKPEIPAAADVPPAVEPEAPPHDPDAFYRNRLGSPEEIKAIEKLIAIRRAKGMIYKADRLEFSRLNIKRAFLLRRKKNPLKGTGVPKIRLVKAQAAERMARKTLEEATAIVDGTVRVFREAIEMYGDIATKELKAFYLDRLQNGTEEQKTEAAANLKEILLTIMQLQKTSANGSRSAKLKATWPDSGAKA